MKELIVMPMTPKRNMYAIRITDIITEAEMQVALTRFKSKRAVIDSIVDFCDFTYNFGLNTLTAKDVHLNDTPRVFDAIANACNRLRNILKLDETLQIDNHKLTNTTLFLLVRYEVPSHECTGDLRS
jgi:hypothetical protein